MTSRALAALWDFGSLWQNSNFYQKARHLWYTPCNSLAHPALSHTPCYNDRPQEQYWRLQQIITSVLVIHINCSGRAKPDIISTWPWAFYFTMSGYEWLKGLITLAIQCFVRVRRQLIGSFLANQRTFGQMSGLSTYWLSFLFGLLLRHNTDHSTLALHSTALLKLQDGDGGGCFQHGGVATNVTSALGTDCELLLYAMGYPVENRPLSV